MTSIIYRQYVLYVIDYIFDELCTIYIIYMVHMYARLHLHVLIYIYLIDS